MKLKAVKVIVNIILEKLLAPILGIIKEEEAKALVNIESRVLALFTNEVKAISGSVFVEIKELTGQK